MTATALILIDLHRGRFGHAVSLLDDLNGKPVLQHTIDRAARIDGLDGIVLLHPGDQSLGGKYVVPPGAPPITTQTLQTRPGDTWLKGVIESGRKWSLTAWRGGIGGMTIYDEILPAYPLAVAAKQCGAESLVLLRGDWCCIDPALASEQLELHRSAPESMKVIFTQAPPGLSPIVVHRSVIEEMAEHSATVANLLCYNPKKPTIDPVGKDVNVQVPASVRDQYRRFVYDTPRAIDHLRAVADELGDRFESADAKAVTDASRAFEVQHPDRQFMRLPQQFTIELTPRREVNGPIVPQHHLDLPRSDMNAVTIDALLDQLPVSGDTAVLFGGLGDALLHEDWFNILQRATQAGLLGVGVETDLLVDGEAVDRLASLPLDAVSVRINADCAATYERLMGVDGFKRVMDNLQRLFQRRNVNRQENKGFQGWVVPRLVKVADNLTDLETFFERWMTVSGWAVVDRALTGRGLIPDLSPVPMEVPRPPGYPIKLNRRKNRLTVLSDGTATFCGQDWLGRLPLGSVNEGGLMAAWRSALTKVEALDACDGSPPICPACADWLEAQRQLLTSVCAADGRERR